MSRPPVSMLPRRTVAEWHPGLTEERLAYLSKEVYPRKEYPALWGHGTVNVDALTLQLVRDNGLPDECAVDTALYDVASFAETFVRAGVTPESVRGRWQRCQPETATEAARAWRSAFLRYGKSGLLVNARMWWEVQGVHFSDGEAKGRRATRVPIQELVREVLLAKLSELRPACDIPIHQQIADFAARPVAEALVEAGVYITETSQCAPS